MDLYQLIYALCAAASAASGIVILLGMAALVIKRAFLTDAAPTDLSHSYK